MKILFVLGFCLVTGEQAYGRVFSFKNETVAPYVKLRGGISSMGSDPLAWQSAPSYSGDDVDLMYGGEFGIYLRGGTFGMSLGVLVHTFDPVMAGLGLNSGGTALYTADVEGLAYGPSLLFDYVLSKTEGYHWNLVFGGGYQFAKIEGTYNFTAAGQPLVSGQTSLTEAYKSDSLFAVVGVSTEFHLSGTTTMSFMLGYHYNLNQEWTYSGGGQNLAGTHSDGGAVLLEDGSPRKIDWSYPFLQIGFQFYVDTVR